jgi:hypothetical protein
MNGRRTPLPRTSPSTAPSPRMLRRRAARLNSSSPATSLAAPAVRKRMPRAQSARYAGNPSRCQSPPLPPLLRLPRPLLSPPSIYPPPVPRAPRPSFAPVFLVPNSLTRIPLDSSQNQARNEKVHELRIAGRFARTRVPNMRGAFSTGREGQLSKHDAVEERLPAPGGAVQGRTAPPPRLAHEGTQNQDPDRCDARELAATCHSCLGTLPCSARRTSDSLNKPHDSTRGTSIAMLTDQTLAPRTRPS